MCQHTLIDTICVYKCTHAHDLTLGICEWAGQVRLYCTALGGQWRTHRYSIIIIII